MTDQELESQARLWHVESTLEQEKAAQLETRLKTTLPQARTRHRWQVASAVALVTLPVVGGTVTLYRSSTLSGTARIEPLRSGNTLQPTQGFFLFANGSVVMGPSGTRSVFRLWKQGSSEAELIAPPPSLAKVFQQGYISGYFSQDEIAGTIEGKKGLYPHHIAFLWEKGVFRLFQPLARYRSASITHISPEGAIGLSSPGEPPVNSKWVKLNTYTYKVGEKTYIYTESRKPRLTFWRVGSAEPLDLEAVLLREKGGSMPSARLEGIKSVREGKKLRLSLGFGNEQRVAVLPTEPQGPLHTGVWEEVQGTLKATKGGQTTGPNGMRIGTQPYGGRGDVMGMIWTSSSAKPRPLWEKTFPFSMFPVSCESVDEEGKVVGMMMNALTEKPIPYVWKSGRYLALQNLLPPNSGWKLDSVVDVKGRFILGYGEYQGGHMLYRLTLPPGCP